ncbi:hypothetical protein CSC74_15580 [Pseudoxanthomonas yeongjuensis]|uniref:hypothetical protein n=1 Tax=Pseudoxanthomonas yeongjuensis TaxID=377616 RepID=UPI00139190B6|nr:hypothetical protein [Pseudoxanthomonas yeongjuensis]KAF1714669.1 hypothetical protein CSC74_15580 [Pseudoxanthomonas yeongjuensis]
MNVVKTCLAVGVVVAGICLWSVYAPEGGVSEVVAKATRRIDSGKTAGGHGFVQIPAPDGQASRGIVIFAPANCPSDAAQRAEALARRLSAEGVPYARSENAEFGSLASPDEVSKVLSVMNGPVPVVFVNGKAKANPTPEEVVAEYRGG